MPNQRLNGYHILQSVFFRNQDWGYMLKLGLLLQRKGVTLLSDMCRTMLTVSIDIYKAGGQVYACEVNHRDYRGHLLAFERYLKNIFSSCLL
jgi:hypothetical protein